MLLRQIVAKNFRSFQDAKFDFNPFLTIIIGENAKGKTNILESIYLIIHGEGFRESKEDELIKFQESKGEVEGNFSSGEETFMLHISIKKSSTGVEKIFTVNRAKRKHFQYLKETTKVILFSPEQIDIILGPPSVRRKYFDILLSSFDLEYKKRLTNYENALRKRNKILETYRDELELVEELRFWNSYLEENGNYLTQKRQEYIDFLNRHTKIDAKEFKIEYVKNEFNSKNLQAKHDLEKRIRRTVIGPQKDDFQISLESEFTKNLHHYGSRSEQRLGLFWLKFNELKFIEEKFRIRPIILLDDIFSELDFKNKKLIFDVIAKYQTIATTTEVEVLDLIDMPKTIIKL